MNCPTCHYNHPIPPKFCTKCGTPLTENKCPQGHVYPRALSSCPYCPKGGLKSVAVAKPVAPPNVSPQPSARQKTVVVQTNKLPGRDRAPTKQVASPQGGYQGQSSKSNTVFFSPGSKTSKASPQPVNTPPGPQPSNQSAASGGTGATPLIGFLYSFSNDSNGVFWPIRVGRLLIGSSPDSDIVLQYPGVSGSHAKITIRSTTRETRMYIRDNDSMNGTLVNGEEIFNEQPSLINGDQIHIGPVVLSVLLLEP